LLTNLFHQFGAIKDTFEISVEGRLSALYVSEVVDRERDTVCMRLLVWLIYGPSDWLIWLNIVSFDASTVRDPIDCAMQRLRAVFAMDGSLDSTFTHWMV
jgi:hypothetical protein